MAQSSLYSSFSIKKIEDVDNLISTIKSKGHFYIEDYHRLLRKAKKSLQPARISRKLNKEVRPLVGTIVSESFICHNNPIVSSTEIWNKDYKASDFVINNGKISLGKYFLKSVKIHKTHSSWLTDIEHIFHIAPERNNDGHILPNQFHFVPYTDLSLLLNEISRQKEEQYREKYIDMIYKEWQKHLFDYLLITNCYFSNSQYNKEILKIIEIQHHYKSSDVVIWDNIKNGTPNISIPMSDITVKDGKIIVKTKNAFFTKQPYCKNKSSYYKEIIFQDECEYLDTPSWDGFFEILLKQYDTSIVNGIYEKLKEKYIKETNEFLQSIKDLQTISFNTYQSKKGFIQCSTKEHLHLFLDNNLKLLYPLSNSYIDFISDKFEYKKTSLNKITDIIDNNWDLFLHNNRYNTETSYWILSDIISTKHKVSNSNYNSQYNLRIVTDYYESRLKIPHGYNCKDNIVTFFYENAKHFSDEDYNKYTETFKTFMIWSKNRNANTISLIPTDTKYTKYLFYIDTTKCSLEVASYVIWRYFSCNICNKRQGFQLNSIFRLFGIHRLCK